MAQCPYKSGAAQAHDGLLSFPSCTQMVTPCGPRFRKSRLLTSPTTAASSSCSASRWPNTKTRGQLLLSRRSLKRCAWSALDGAPRSRNTQKNTANKQRRTISNPVFVLLHPPLLHPPSIDHVHRPKEKLEREYIPQAVQMVRYQTHFCDLMRFARVPSFLLFVLSVQHK